MPRINTTSLTVEPIRKAKDIKSISRLLKFRPGDLLHRVIGINNGLQVKYNLVKNSLLIETEEE